MNDSTMTPVRLVPDDELRFQRPTTEAPEIAAAIQSLSIAGGIEARGAIYTRAEVVDFLLDLTGYSEANDPVHLRLLEPSFGGGDFLLAAIRRLVTAWRATDSKKAASELSDCIRAVELHEETFLATKGQVIELLATFGISGTEAVSLADVWLIHGDFLLVDLPMTFHVVIGNPPYVRQELIPEILLNEYRKRYSTIFDRADLYVPFIERSLHSLAAGGSLGFICADRWMKNRYGGPLRKLVADSFHFKVFVDMVNTPAFHSDVTAYPAITLIERTAPGPTRITHQPTLEATSLRELARKLLAHEIPAGDLQVSELKSVTSGAEPWILNATAELDLVRRLEATFPKLEDAGCKVGIGVATGADEAFIGPFDELDVEDDRKEPLVMTRDISEGTVKWRGFGVVNPFAEEGGLVNLEKFPRLQRYLEGRKEQIAGRHVAKKIPANWYRTIDRITPSLTKKPKLLIPDIKGDAHIVFESGELYPHHNLYYVTSESWNLRALQAVLKSAVTRLFIATYSTKMRGGFLRFQAQYLRRLRLPSWESVPQNIRSALIDGAERGDLAACNTATFKLYGLTAAEEAVLTKAEA
jgi:hypothetical protein